MKLRPPRLRALLVGVLSGAVTVGLLVGSTQAAEAAAIRYQVFNVTSVASQVGTVFADCRVTTTGGVCTITKGRSASRDIQVSLGVSRSEVAANLSISSSTSVSVGVSCTSPTLKAGQVWKARSVGTRYYYNVRKQEGRASGKVPTYKWTTVATSGRLTAHNPSPNRISCGL